MSTEELTRAVDLLVRQVAHWESPRWATATADGRSRGDVVHDLVQRLADLVAGLEREPRRAVPRLPGDLVLPDQVRVMAADLVAAGAPADTLAAATAAVNLARRDM